MEYNNIVIGNSIRELRKAHHMTQMELGEKLDISFTHCSQLEQGRHKMSVDLLFRMMILFQVNVNTILGITETEEESIKISSSMHCPFVRRAKGRN